MSGKTRTTYILGIIEGNDSFDDAEGLKDHYLPNLLLTKIKIWFGPNNSRSAKSLLGLQADYLDFGTGKQIECEYHGGKRESELIETKELKFGPGDYLNKVYLGFGEYITHLKLVSSKGNSIEFGQEKSEEERPLKVNDGDNIYQFFFGRTTSEGIRAIGFHYIERKDFIFSRRLEVLRIRYMARHDNSKKEEWLNNIKNLPSPMQFLLKCSVLPDACFASILKYT